VKGAVWRGSEHMEEWIGQLSKDEPVVTVSVYAALNNAATAT
jgi:formylglycine-generating enzyme required for sulfatase activity